MSELPKTMAATRFDTETAALILRGGVPSSGDHSGVLATRLSVTAYRKQRSPIFMPCWYDSTTFDPSGQAKFESTWVTVGCNGQPTIVANTVKSIKSRNTSTG